MTMTRDEIIRALRCRATDKERNRCPLYLRDYDCTPCFGETQPAAAALIERLEAELKEGKKNADM